MLARIYALPASMWTRMTLRSLTRKYRTPRVLDERVNLAIGLMIHAQVRSYVMRKERGLVSATPAAGMTVERPTVGGQTRLDNWETGPVRTGTLRSLFREDSSPTSSLSAVPMPAE